ncbi:MAG: carboxynorspermidine decarboxylase [Bacteroidota bacterium]
MMYKQLPHIPTPCFVLEEEKLEVNLKILERVQRKTGVDILLALKGFALWASFPLVKQYLAGATASSLNEAKLCYEMLGSLAHCYFVAYLPEEFEQVIDISSHVSFNSIEEYKRFKELLHTHPSAPSAGIRVNPLYSNVNSEVNNPASRNSRLGVLPEELQGGLPVGIEGLHVHTLGESDSFALEQLIKALEKYYESFLHQVKWINLGGGHLMTDAKYDLEHGIKLLSEFREKYELEVLLEPGSAVAWQTGVLLCRVMDIIPREPYPIAILDVSFSAHIPDTLEMPYNPKIRGASMPISGKPTYTLGGISCLAGDYLSAYSFDQELKVGDRLIIEDMIHYTMVKTTMFNGVKHPSIAIQRKDKSIEIIRNFTYEDYKSRLS